MDEEEIMGRTDFDHKPNTHDSKDIAGRGHREQKPVDSEDDERRDAHSLPGTNQAGTGPGADDEDDRQTNQPRETEAPTSHRSERPS